MTQHPLVGGLPVEEGGYRDRVTQNAGSFQHLAGGEKAHRPVGPVDLDTLGPPEPHHSDEAGAGVEQFGDLDAQVGLVLALTGLCHRQARG